MVTSQRLFTEGKIAAKYSSATYQKHKGGGMTLRVRPMVKLSKSDSAFNFETKKEDVDFIFFKERQILAQAPVPGKPIIANPGLNIANCGISFLRYIFLEAGGRKTCSIGFCWRDNLAFRNNFLTHD